MFLVNFSVMTCPMREDSLRIIGFLLLNELSSEEFGLGMKVETKQCKLRSTMVQHSVIQSLVWKLLSMP